MAFSLQRNLQITAIFVLLCKFTYPAISQTVYQSSYSSNNNGQSVGQYVSSAYEYAIAQARARAAAAEAQYEASLEPAPAPQNNNSPSEASVAKAHERWMAKYGRIYSNQTEKNTRFNIFKQNLEYIYSFNSAGNSRYRLGLNQFADLTKEEFLASFVGFKGSRLRNSPSMPPFNTSDCSENGGPWKHCSENGGPWEPVNKSDVPASMDWREKGAVTRPKDQHPCGLDPDHGDISNSGIIFPSGIDQLNASNLCRCESLLSALGNSWAFSAVAAVEGLVKIKTKKLTSLSEQQLMDCANSDEENQDNGENPIDNAFKYIIKNKGLAAENDYPYEGKMNGICEKKKANKSAANITCFVDVPPNSQEDLLQAVSQRPVSAAIAICGHLQFYENGTYDCECGSNWLNLGVTVIGYGANVDGNFWLIKNPWGGSWGMDGYMMLRRDNGASQGCCGIAMKASYPTG